MKERPILFSAPMVRAILDGRKTQTRRIVNPQPIQPGPQCLRLYSRPDGLFVWCSESGVALMEPHEMRCPYGKTGDRLWVKETHRFLRETIGLECPRFAVSCQYRATEGVCDFAHWPCVAHSEQDVLPNGWGKFHPSIGEHRGFVVTKPTKWRPSIFMPRWASRITLEVNAVRVERLQAISNEDACDEGCWDWELTNPPSEYPKSKLLVYNNRDASDKYRELWESINGPGSWAANPFVWVLSFKRII